MFPQLRLQLEIETIYFLISCVSYKAFVLLH